MLVDSHCHLDFPEFAPEVDAVIARAKAAGVLRMITISTRVAEAETYRRLAEAHEEVWFSVGTHPHNAHEETDVAAADLVALAGHPKCVAIGETGLDYHYDRAPRDIAATVFRRHIAAAREAGVPLVIHARDADAEVAAILREEMRNGAFNALLHCFTGSRQLAEAVLELGLAISFSGVLTFKNSGDLRAIARDVPLDRLIVETDAPFLAPVPYRGKRNEPAFVVETAKVLAAIKGVSEAQLATTTTDNVLRLFSKLPARSAREKGAADP